MNTVHTLQHTPSGCSIRTLRVSVVAGPNKGLTSAVRTDRVTIGSAPGNDLVLTDETVSRYHLELRAEGGRIFVEDHGSTNGTSAGPVHIVRGVISPGTILKLGRSAVRVDDGVAIDVPLHDSDAFSGLRGRTNAMRRLMAELARVARSNASVLLLGETGTGKEVIARAIHQASPRASGPFEIVDCGALMPTLIASELFGHEKGAFTGADQQHLGAVERANGGTIFLDEIGELPEQLQVRLLGVLERRLFRRVGGSKAINVDVRVVAATHRDLRRWVNRGQFRQDLYFRIAVARLEIPPLRDRSEDIPLLVEHFLREMGELGPVERIVSSPVMEALKAYHWPGNVRELRNFVESAVAFGEARAPVTEDDGEEDGDGEPRGFLGVPLARLYRTPYREARDRVLCDFQEAYFRELLERTRGNVARAAELAKMNRPHMFQLMKKHGLRSSARGGEELME